MKAFMKGFASHQSQECEHENDGKAIEKSIKNGDAYTRSFPSARRLADELSIDLRTVSVQVGEDGSRRRMSEPPVPQMSGSKKVSI